MIKDHGMKFGLQQRVADNWRIKMVTHGGCLERLRGVDDITGEMIVKFGNNFDSEWIHPNQIPHLNWYFFDNPEIPQLINPNPANPEGYKTFVRFTRGDLFTNNINSTRDVDRLNSVLTDLAGEATTVESLVRPVPVRIKNSRRVLLCPSSSGAFKYYYNTSRDQWIERWSAYLEHHGYEPVVRYKPTRRQRVESSEYRLYDHLVLNDYFCTLSQHSVSAFESILAGTPAVVTGPSSAGELATPHREFALGILRVPESDSVWRWVERVASNTYHKSELFSGAWHQ